MVLEWIKQIFCHHLTWHKAFPTKGFPGYYETEWACDDCDKRTILNNDDQPLQYIKDSIRR